MNRLLLALFLCVGIVKISVAADEDVLTVLYASIGEQSANEIAPSYTAMAFLKNIQELDGNLRVANDDDKISLYYKGILVKSLRKPQDENPESWANISGEILDLAYKKSAKARNMDFEAVDIILNKAVKSLGKDTKYYPSLVDDGRVKHRRHFSARVEDDILWVKIGAFNNFTKEEFAKALVDNVTAKSLILDLRSSPGGNLTVAIEVADLFLDEGIVISTRGRDKEKVVYYNSKDGDAWEGKPIVVLVDGDTASAAEVLAVALQEQSRAKIVGTKTVGKGSIQNLIRLPNRATLAITNAYFYTPSGEKLDEKGVIPDFCTFEMPENKDVLRIIEAGKDDACGREGRENGALEPEIAKELLKI